MAITSEPSRCRTALLLAAGCLFGALQTAWAIPPPPSSNQSSLFRLKPLKGEKQEDCGATLVEMETEKYVGTHPASCHVSYSTNCSVTYSPIECPKECPFFSPNYAFSCLFSCTDKANCSAYNPTRPYADKNLKVCMPCEIAGCKSCSSPSHCNACHDHFILQDNGTACVFDQDASGVWDKIAMVVKIVVVGIVLLGIVWGLCGPGNPNHEVNNFAICRARRHRHLVKTLLWELNNKRVACEFPSLAFNVHSKNFAGLGLALFYNNIVFCTFIAMCYWWTTDGAFNASGVEQALGNFDADPIELYQNGFMASKGAPAVVVSRLYVCSGQAKIKDSISDFSKSNFESLCVLWVVFFVALFFFTKSQKAAAAKFNQKNSTMSDFSIRITGLPKDEVDESKVRKWIEEKLRETFPEKLQRPPRVEDMGKHQGDIIQARENDYIEVFGVSLCYDYFEHWGEVDTAISCMTMRLEVEAAEEANAKIEERQSAAHLIPVHKTSASRRNMTAQHIGGHDAVKSARSEACALMRKFFDGPPEQRMKTNGEAFVVFMYSDDVTHIWKELSSFKPDQASHPLNNLQYPGSIEKIQFHFVWSEPPSVNWQFLGNSVEAKTVLKAVSWIFFLLMVLIVVPIFCYYKFILKPYAHLGAAATGSKTAVMGMILGLLNTIVNIQTYATSYNVGFHRREHMDMMVLICTVGFTLLNIGFSFLIVFAQAYGKVLDAVPWHVFSNIDGLELLGVENEIGQNIFMMMYPGFFFVGSSMTIVMAGMWPWIFNTFLAKVVYVWAALPRPLLKALRPIVPWAPDDIEIYPVWRAERGLEPMEIQIGDSANLIIVPTVCSVLLFVLSRFTHTLFKYMFIWGIFYYFFLRYLHFRFCKKCYYTTNQVDNIVNYLYGMPLGMLASACIQWGFRSNMIRFPHGLEHWDRLKIAICALAGLSSWALWAAIYHKVVQPWADTSQIGAEEEFKLTVLECKENTTYSWFNCNPVFVLKCAFYWHDEQGKCKHPLRNGHPLASGEDPEQVRFFAIGKEYLFLRPERQYLAFPLHRHDGLPGDMLEFETYYELILDKVFSKLALSGTEKPKTTLSENESEERALLMIGPETPLSEAKMPLTSTA